MAGHSPRQRLQDILDAIAAIESYAAGKDLATYSAEPMLRDAIERNVERISEASRYLPDELKEAHAGIPWHEIAAIGNVLRHAYVTVDDREIWGVVSDELPPLRAAVESMIREVEDRHKG